MIASRPPICFGRHLAQRVSRMPAPSSWNTPRPCRRWPSGHRWPGRPRPSHSGPDILSTAPNQVSARVRSLSAFSRQGSRIFTKCGSFRRYSVVKSATGAGRGRLRWHRCVRTRERESDAGSGLGSEREISDTRLRDDYSTAYLGRERASLSGQRSVRQDRADLDQITAARSFPRFHRQKLALGRRWLSLQRGGLAD